MIELTRLNGNRMAVNGELIQFAESAPDTMLTMVTGEKLLVAENLAEVAERMIAYRARTLADASRLLPGGLALGPGAALRSIASNDREDADEESAGLMRRRRAAL